MNLFWRSTLHVLLVDTRPVVAKILQTEQKLAVFLLRPPRDSMSRERRRGVVIIMIAAARDGDGEAHYE